MLSENEKNSTSLTLLDKVKLNEEEAWSQFVNFYASLVYSRCRTRWNLQPEDAENISQDTFSAVIRSIGGFDRQRTGSLRSWLRKITDNKCRDWLKRNHAPKALGGSESLRLIEDLPDDTQFEDDTLFEKNERRLLIRNVMKVLGNEYSSRDLKIFWCVVVEEMYRDEIAKDFGVTVNVVYIVCTRIRKRLKEIFDDLMDDELLKRIDEMTTDEEELA